jgi:hypothetical protein
VGLDKQAQEELAALPPPRPSPGVTLDQTIDLRVDAYLLNAGADTRRTDLKALVRDRVSRAGR